MSHCDREDTTRAVAQCLCGRCRPKTELEDIFAEMSLDNTGAEAGRAAQKCALETMS